MELTLTLYLVLMWLKWSSCSIGGSNYMEILLQKNINKQSAHSPRHPITHNFQPVDPCDPVYWYSGARPDFCKNTLLGSTAIFILNETMAGKPKSKSKHKRTTLTPTPPAFYSNTQYPMPISYPFQSYPYGSIPYSQHQLTPSQNLPMLSPQDRQILMMTLSQQLQRQGIDLFTAQLLEQLQPHLFQVQGAEIQPQNHIIKANVVEPSVQQSQPIIKQLEPISQQIQPVFLDGQLQIQQAQLNTTEGEAFKQQAKTTNIEIQDKGIHQNVTVVETRTMHPELPVPPQYQPIPYKYTFQQNQQMMPPRQDTPTPGRGEGWSSISQYLPLGLQPPQGHEIPSLYQQIPLQYQQIKQPYPQIPIQFPPLPYDNSPQYYSPRHI